VTREHVYLLWYCPGNARHLLEGVFATQEGAKAHARDLHLDLRTQPAPSTWHERHEAYWQTCPLNEPTDTTPHWAISQRNVNP
jgi:hypothetical protein